MEEVEKPAHTFDYLIIGAGPAGLQLGYCLAEAGLDYVILEAGEAPGTFFKTFPRHRKLISSNKVYTGFGDRELNLRWDWNSLLCDDDDLLFKNYSREYFPHPDDLLRYLADFAGRYDLRVRYGVRVAGVSRPGPFVATTEGGEEFHARVLVVATGVSRPHLPPIPGIELAEPYTEVSTDPEDFTGQRVLILGKGNSAFETAENLIATTALIHVASPHPLKLAWKTHFVGHLRAVNNNFLDTYQLKSQNAVLDATVCAIRREGDEYVVDVEYSHARGETERLVYDRVIACTGFRFDHSIFDEGCRPALTIDDRFPAQTSAWESATVPGLYFAGTLTQARDFKKTTSGFIHGFRYNSRALSRIFEARYHGRPWPARHVAATAEGLAEAALARLNRSSALWQQFGFFCDVIEPRGGAAARYYEDVPTDFATEGGLGLEDSYFTVSLEFGKIEGDPFCIERDPTPERAEKSVLLHPVIRHRRGGAVLAELHLLENLYGQWIDPALHTRPLRDFFERETAAPATRPAAGARL